MKVETTPRQLGELPIGGLALVPLMALPLGAWAIETGRFAFSQCGFKTLFDVPCLSCGSTRATIHLLHGDVFTALAFQPLTMFVYALLAVWGAASLWAFATRRSLHVDLSPREDIAFKVSIIALPLMNWAYLIWAGV